MTDTKELVERVRAQLLLFVSKGRRGNYPDYALAALSELEARLEAAERERDEAISVASHFRSLIIARAAVGRAKQ